MTGSWSITGELLGYEYRIVVSDEALASYLAEVYRDSTGPVVAPEVIEVREASANDHRIVVDGAVVESRLGREHVIPSLVTVVNQRSIEHRAASDASVGAGVVIHAGAVASGDAGVVIIGPTGTGKSTAAISLARSGFEYISDDAVVISANGRLEGSRKPVGIRTPTWELLGLDLPGSARPPEGYGPVASLPVAASACGVSFANHARLRLIVFPVREPVPGGVVTIRRSIALQRIVESTFDRTALPSGGLRALGASLQGDVRAVEWERGSLRVLTTTVRDLLARS